MKPLYFAYYTKHTLYEKEVEKLEASLQKYSLNYFIQPIENLGSWQRNINIKASLIQKKLLSITDPLVYVDCDAEFVSYPELFEMLTCDVAVHEFDRSLYQPNRKGCKKEILSGTIFFNQTEKAKEILNKWVELCKRQSSVWDQKLLDQVLAGDFYQLPPQYCCIFDTMACVENKVIVHYQASRQARKIERK